MHRILILGGQGGSAMRKAVVGLLAAVLLLVAVPGVALAGRGGGEVAGRGAAAPQGHGDGWLF